jgi:hypothetical protein
MRGMAPRYRLEKLTVAAMIEPVTLKNEKKSAVLERSA